MPRNRTPNQPIGTVLCPFKNCDEVVPLYRYRKQTDDQAKQRRAGKLYARCPKHGMTQDQEWLLENGDIPVAEEALTPPESTTAPAADVVLDVAKTDDASAAEASSAPDPEPKKETFGFF